MSELHNIDNRLNSKITDIILNDIDTDDTEQFITVSDYVNSLWIRKVKLQYDKLMNIACRLNKPEVITIMVGTDIGTPINYNSLADCFMTDHLDKDVIGFKLGSIEIGDMCNKKRKNNTINSRKKVKSFDNQATMVIRVNKIKRLKVKIFNTGKIGIPGCIDFNLDDAKFAIKKVTDKLKEVHADYPELQIIKEKIDDSSNINVQMVKTNCTFDNIYYLDKDALKRFLQSSDGHYVKVKINHNPDYTGLSTDVNFDGAYASTTIFPTGKLMFSFSNYKHDHIKMSHMMPLIQKVQDTMIHFMRYIIIENGGLYCKIINKDKNNKQDRINLYIYNKKIRSDRLINIRDSDSFSVDIQMIADHYRTKKGCTVDMVGNNKMIMTTEHITLTMFSYGNTFIKGDNIDHLMNTFTFIQHFISKNPSVIRLNKTKKKRKSYVKRVVLKDPNVIEVNKGIELAKNRLSKLMNQL